MTPITMLMRALLDDSPKIYTCRNPHTKRWITTQHGNVIADAKHPKDALAVARAQAQKLPKSRDTSRNANVVVEAVGRLSGSSNIRASTGAGLG